MIDRFPVRLLSVSLAAICSGAVVLILATQGRTADDGGASSRRAPATLAPPRSIPPEDHPTLVREAAAAEAAAREKIFNSEEWREVERAWQQWLSVQKIYDANDVARMKRDYHARIAAMNSRELASFLEDMRDKIQVLLSPEARKARVWLGQYLALHAAIPKDQFKKMVPDVANMSSEQIIESLQDWEQRQASVRQTQAAFDEGRRQQVANIQAQERQTQEAEERALDRASQDMNRSQPLTNGPGSPYSPTPMPQMNYSIILW